MRPIQNKIVAISLVTFFVLSLIALGFSPEAAASEPPELQSIPGTEIILRADERYTPNRIAPPEMPELGVQSTMIIVNYNGFPPEAQAAFQRAVDIWASLITSTVTIEVEANWKPMSYGVLGASRPLKLVGNFPNAPATWTWYPVGLANALSGYDLYPDTGDITVDLNSNFSNWYLGLDGNPAGNQYDLMTVALHELTHGLGFYASMNVNGGQGSWGLVSFPVIYERFSTDGAGVSLTNKSVYHNPSTALAGPLLGGSPAPGGTFFAGPNATAANGGTPPKLYTPPTWESGSSYTHLDDNTYDNTSNALMTHALGLGESAHHPGPVTLGILRDLGWQASNSSGDVGGGSNGGDGGGDSGDDGNPNNVNSGKFSLYLPIVFG